MNIAERLRALNDVSVPQKFSIYLPDRDRESNPIGDIEQWIERAIVMMVRINGGCTVLPPATGAWQDSTSGDLIRESTTVIYSFLMKPKEFEERFDVIKNFLHDYGITTNQDEVLAEMAGWTGESYKCEAYRIPHCNYEPVD